MNRKIREALQECVERSVAGTSVLRSLLRENPVDFLLVSVSLLHDEPDSPGQGRLLKLLAGSDQVIEAICDPTFMTHEQASHLTGMLAGAEPHIDTKLARLLQRVHARLGDQAHPESVDRILALLDAIPSSARTLPVLASLLHDPNPRLRAKLALLVGRRVGNTKFAAERQEERDPRVRANAIESLWGDKAPTASSVLRRAAQDPNNRVVGNALLGLYQLQDPQATQSIVAMSVDSRPAFRATAAWAMGQTVNPRFIPCLEKLTHDLYAPVRNNATKALKQIRLKTVCVREPA